MTVVATIHVDDREVVDAVLEAVSDALGSDCFVDRADGVVTVQSSDAAFGHPASRRQSEDARAALRRERLQRARRPTVAPAGDTTSKLDAVVACWVDGMSTPELADAVVERHDWQLTTAYKWIGKARADGLIPKAPAVDLGPISKVPFNPDDARDRAGR